VNDVSDGKAVMISSKYCRSKEQLALRQTTAARTESGFCCSLSKKFTPELNPLCNLLFSAPPRASHPPDLLLTTSSCHHLNLRRGYRSVRA